MVSHQRRAARPGDPSKKGLPEARQSVGYACEVSYAPSGEVHFLPGARVQYEGHEGQRVLHARLPAQIGEGS